MNYKIKISIPEPCFESWLKMSPTEKGRFCNNCQKNVIDFTKSSDREIVTAFNKNNKLCGRFNNFQINRDLIITKEKKSIWIIAATSIIAFLGIGNQTAKAQEITKTEQTDKKQLKNYTDSSIAVKKYSGILYDENKVPLPGANLIIKGTKNQTNTNFNGEFTIKAKKGDILVFSYIGYENLEFKLKKSTKISIAFKKSNVELLGEVIIIKHED